MNERERLDEFQAIVNERLNQLNEIVSVALAHMKNDIQSDEAMRRIENILTQENR